MVQLIWVVFLLMLLKPELSGAVTNKPLFLQQDSLAARQMFRDSITTNDSTASKDSIKTVRQTSRNGRDTIVVYSARDSVRYSIKNKTLRLRGNAFVNNRKQTLEAEIIEIYFDNAFMKAESVRDSAGKIYGIPKFTDAGETYYGQKLTYNFVTKRGTVTVAETNLGEGFYWGEKIKRVSENTIFVKDGSFTSCDKPHPHFYFKSPRMKVIAQDRVFVDELIVYVEDIPVFYLPISAFFENKSGRRSGIIIPQFFFPTPLGNVEGRGAVFQNLGYYWAASDYFDTQLTADIYSKGGFLLTSSSRYNVRDNFSGSLNVSWGNVRIGVTQPASESWNISLSHNQQFDPQTNISGNLTYSSTGYNKNTQLDALARAQQNAFSNFSLRRQFDNGTTVSLTYSRSQNIVNGQAEDILRPTFGAAQIYPFRKLVASDSWLADVNIQYNPDISLTWFRPPVIDTVILSEQGVPVQQRPVLNQVQRLPFTAVLRNNPSISIAPRLGYFTISPRLEYRDAWYIWKLHRVLDPNDTSQTTVLDSLERGFFREYDWSVGVSIGTKVFGLLNPNILGLQSIRHTLQANVGYYFKPNLSSHDDLFGSYISKEGKKIQYSRFLYDAGGFASQQLQNSFNIGLNNTFEAKIKTTIDNRDTVKKVELLNVNLSADYNFTADSLRWSSPAVNFYTNAANISISGSAYFDLYDIDSTRLNGKLVYERVNRFLWSSGKGLARLTNFTMSLSASFPQPDNAPSTTPQQQPPAQQPTERNDSASNVMGERFRQRLDTTYQKDDIYGDSTPGYIPIDVPWNLSLNSSFSYTPALTPDSKPYFSSAVSGNFSLQIAKTWRVSTSLTYDIFQQYLSIPGINISKDIHCWELSVVWYPTLQGFSLRFGAKAPMLHDLELRKRGGPIYR